MKKVLFDSDVIIDVLSRREPFFRASFQALNLVNLRLIQGYISAHAVTNIFYILRKQLGIPTTLTLLQTLLEEICIAPINDSVIHAALTNPQNDFEDAVTREAARASHIDYIVTRNLKDYTQSSIPAFLPEQLLANIISDS